MAHGQAMAKGGREDPVKSPDSTTANSQEFVPSACWASNPSIQKYMKSNNLTSFADLETLFEQRLLDLLKKQGTSYIVWQEIFDNGAKIAPDTGKYV